MSTTASSGVSSGTYSSSRTSTSGIISSVISPITSSTSGSALHTFTAFSLSHSGIFTSQMSELGSILSNGYQSDSTFLSVSPATTFPSDFSILSSVSSSDPTTSTTSSTSSTTSCSATPSSTNPCPQLQLVGNDPEPLEEDKPITDEKVAECENWLESNVEPPEGPTDSPEYKAWDQMRDRCSRIENVDKNVATRKEYILQQSSVFRYECVQETVAWLKKHADKIQGLPEWLEEHKDDWYSPCGPGI
ncbi:hypothetical protein BCIN_16g02160 [Botrytis cinerea B05.10]|uniref:Uncharacterized protein n=1 Tax=Botryotinia fuckeliana (strain B05.10) TaxID=332648 RepID=A0A384K6I0_BOTFB|nr:hypothetical protein BCIN_16g02160 [Botrytis cinerea B05.10]ATZ58435.1 hypothetical protein BCIN_16g02160 [Botrytis cinerea B05.10]